MIVTVRDYCLRLLQSGDLATKLAPPRTPDGGRLDDREPGPPLHVEAPARAPALRFQKGAGRLPSLAELKDPGARITTLARFAHHELMAAELFAWALLQWPDLPPSLRRGFLGALEEEQIHLGLYLDRLAAHGARLGDEPLSDYFWQHVPAIAAGGPSAFLAAMGLTFEQANLDFTLLYRDAFRAAGDEETAQVLQRVHDDEIGHVRLAAVWIRRLAGGRSGSEADARSAGGGANAKTDCARQRACPPSGPAVAGPHGGHVSEREAYEAAVPFPLSAARAKARRFDVKARRRAGLSDEFIEWVRAARPYGR